MGTIIDDLDSINANLYTLTNHIVSGAPSGTITITENGTGIDVAQYAMADVNVSGGVDFGDSFEVSFYTTNSEPLAFFVGCVSPFSFDVNALGTATLPSSDPAYMFRDFEIAETAVSYPLDSATAMIAYRDEEATEFTDFEVITEEHPLLGTSKAISLSVAPQVAEGTPYIEFTLTQGQVPK